MKKETKKTPLEALDDLWYGQKNTENYQIVYKTLKDAEHFNKLYMPSLKKGYTLQEMEKSLRALEIIKNKKVDVGQMIEAWQSFPFTYSHYLQNKDNYSFETLTESEFNLLNEVLL